MTSKSRSALTTEQTANFPDNTTGAITPSILRTTVQDMIDSMATQLDSSAFGGTAYSFTGSVAFTASITATAGITSPGSAATSLLGGTGSTSSLILQSTSFGSTQTSDSILVQGASITLKANASISTAVAIGVAGSAYGTLAIAGSTSGTTTIVPTGAASGTQTLQATTDTFVYLSTTDTLNNKTIGSALTFNGSTSGTTKIIATGAASGTLTLPAATDTIVGKNTTDILTNKTINTGSTSAIQIGSVTLSIGQYPGTITNDNATAGNYGEYTNSSISSGSAVGLSSGVAANVTSIALPAGDWDIAGNIQFLGSTTTTVTWLEGSLSATSATVDTSNDRVNVVFYNSTTAFSTLPGFLTVPVGPSRFSVSVSTTTAFMVARASFGVSTCSAYGEIRARRVR